MNEMNSKKKGIQLPTVHAQSLGSKESNLVSLSSN